MGILSLFFVLTSCTKDEDDKSLENLNAVTGVYFGVLVGSTGAYEAEFTENGATLAKFYSYAPFFYHQSEFCQTNKCSFSSINRRIRSPHFKEL